MPPLMSVLLTEEDANNPLANLGVKLSINSEPTNRESFLKKCCKKENISFIKIPATRLNNFQSCQIVLSSAGAEYQLVRMKYRAKF